MGGARKEEGVEEGGRQTQGREEKEGRGRHGRAPLLPSGRHGQGTLSLGSNPLVSLNIKKMAGVSVTFNAEIKCTVNVQSMLLKLSCPWISSG